jgi:thymidine phosphorylase
MQAIIKAQGKNPNPPQIGRLQHDILASENGYVTAIDNLQLARVAHLAGAPMDKGAGVELHRKLGDQVTAGESIYTIYAEFPGDFDFARELAQKDSGINIGEEYVDEGY